MKYIKYLIILLAAALFINCGDDKDDKAWLWGLAWLSQSSTTETATVEVTGTAKDGDGNVISNGTVSVSETTSSSIQARASITSSTTTDDSGNFTLYLKVAKFKITVKKSDGTEVGSFELDIQNTTEQHVQATNVTSLTITLTSAKPVGGDTDLLAAGNSSTSPSCTGSSVTRDWGTFTDCEDGTVKLEVTAGTYGGNTYTTKTLYFAKCSHDQSWNSSSNDCTGTGNSGDNYGATTVQYCSTADNTCNGGTNDGTLNGSGTSGAYTACNSLSLASKSWRVPTKDELKLLIECTDQSMPTDGNNCGSGNYSSPTFNNLFPNTLSNYYWSSSGDSANSGNARLVRFFNGTTASSSKTTSVYVRCASE